MAKRLVLILIAFFSIGSAFSQTRTLSGTVLDGQAKTPLIRASVSLKSLTDSATQSTLTDSTGTFTFTGLNRDSFLLSFSFVGFKPFARTVVIDSTDISIDIAAVPGSSSGDLETVVIRTSISPVSQKGDTLQINASQYKVNPDASGEDLVKKVPGITIENGQVKAQGENVQKVTIDGRELFGDDATAALRNLPAEIIDKIQIFDRLSDQAQFTGFDDGNTSKSINIVTKANMRNGQFGRVFAGYGTDDRYSVGGNATFLKENRRISLVGNFNNINQQNFSQQDLLGVTSNAQRGGGGGGPRGGGGSPRSGAGGNRGQGGQGGGNTGGFGNNGNFLVGQQNGINRTNAFGINYSNNWGPKVTLTGSYFFNNSNNTTNEIANTQYLGSKVPNSVDRSLDTTISDSRNTNHRVNLRLEYKIDSFNQLTITPNLSFQNNHSERYVNRTSFFNEGSAIQQTINRSNTNSDRSGNNLNNTILYRHSFRKRGRTFSINFNTAYNRRNGESYINTFNNIIRTSGTTDTATSQFTDQLSHGLQLSTNIVYTEPLGQNSQLQFNYNPSVSKSTSDQKTYDRNPINSEYTIFRDSLSNIFENKTTAQNAGLSYRYGNRDRQLSFGVNYQHTNLNSDQTFPRALTVNKSFNNILPNANFRYKLSTRSSMRIFYRANVNQPSVTQLQSVLDRSNAPTYTIGNPDLNQQYSHIVSTQYTYTNTSKGLLLVGNVFYQAASNYIATAIFNPSKDTVVNGGTVEAGSQLIKPVNLNGYNNLRSFVTFAIPLKFIKSNLNLNTGLSLSTLPGFIDYTQNTTKTTTYTLGAVIASNVSQYVDFTVSYSANFSKAKTDKTLASNTNYFQHIAGLQMNLLSKKGWFFQNDLNNQYYTGLSQGFNQSYFLWNMSLGKKFLKDQKGELKISVFDLLRQNQSIVREVTSSYIQDIQNQVLRRYFLLTFTYNLRNFGTAATRSMNRGGGGNWNGGMPSGR